MRDFIGIILVTMSVLRQGDCAAGHCGTLYFDKPSYNVGSCASLIYKPADPNADLKWFRELGHVTPLNISSKSKYSESNQSGQFTLTINKIEEADAGSYIVSCTSGYSERAKLHINTSSGAFHCGQLEFEKLNVYRGESASLIYKPDCAMASVAWYKTEPERNVRLFPNKTSESSTKYTELKTNEGFILRISETELADAGNYIVSCGTWSHYAKLIVEVNEPIRPSNPEFQDVEDIHNCSKCLPARLNVNMTVKCFAVVGSEPVELNLFQSEELLSNVHRNNDSNSKTNMITYNFIPTSDNFDTVFKCTVKIPALQVEKAVNTRLYIKVDPVSIDIKTQPTRENETSNVQCTTINGRPPITSLFYLNNSQQNSVNITKTIQSGYTYNVTTTLWRKLTRQDNRASVNCCSDSTRRVCTNIEYLNVTFFPKSVVLTEISKLNKENGDMVLILKCDVDESNPKSFVGWKGIKNLTRQRLEEKYINHTASHGWTYTTSWMFNLSREDRRRNIRCQVKNSEFPELKLQQSYTPYITYSPVVTISENRNKTVYIGDDLKLTCDVDSNPPSVITWSSKDVKMEESNGTNKLDLHLVNVTLEHSQTYTCTARNGIGGKKSRDITMSVKVPSEKTFNQPSSEANSNPLVVPVIVGAVVIIMAIVAVVVFLILWKKRNDAAPKRKGTAHQIKVEPRHESDHPARDERLHNGMPASNEKEVDNAPEYACVLPKANRKHGADQVKPEDAPEYAGVIPKAKRKSEPAHLKSEDAPEYAGVLPKAKRKHGTDNLKSEEYACVIPKAENNTEWTRDEICKGGQLVYAELDLNFDSENAARRYLVKQYEPTEYAQIDLCKAGTVKVHKREMATGAVKIVHDEIAKGIARKGE